MKLRRLELTNFKNIARAELDFSARVNCFVGNNGMGKSNLLDAIHYMSVCRSFTGMADKELVRQGESFLLVKALYDRRDAEEEITLGIAPGRRKSLRRGGKEYRRLAEHIGLFPLVMSAPADEYLVRGSGEERRRWIDMVVSMSDRTYLEALMNYNRCLEQRNAMLRNQISDSLMYEAVESGMTAAAGIITEARAEGVLRLRDIFLPIFEAVGGSGEIPGLSYRPSGERLEEALESARQRDLAVGHTTVGPHRDDIEMTINGLPLRRAGSQGQCKTFTVALRMAQYDFLKRGCGVRPLLLLDDIFDKLDAKRVERIMEIVAGGDFGQIFITDTNRDHLDRIVAGMSLDSADCRLWRVEDGTFTPVEHLS